LITGVNGSSVNSKRIEGYLKAMNDAGITVPSEWMVPGKSQYQQSYTAATILMNKKGQERPTAILTAGDIAALGVMDAAKDMGLDVPGDLAVIGFDDLFLAEYRTIQLTTVRVPRYEIGQQATRILFDRINRSGPPGNMHIILPTNLIVRRTCGANIGN
jgi:DNA-binding LacI/PurR family transcriptional regulator